MWRTLSAYFLGCAVIVGVLIIGGIYAFSQYRTSYRNVSSFEECVAGNFSIREEFGQKECVLPNGVIFIDIENETPPTGSNGGTTICKNSCGDNYCQEDTCTGADCPCIEDESSCPTDCGGEPTGICANLCGDDVCQEVVCEGEGCPCAESKDLCPEDCSIPE